MLKYPLLLAVFLLTSVIDLKSQNDYAIYDAGFIMYPGRVEVYANGKKIYEPVDWLGNYAENKVKIVNKAITEHNAYIEIMEKSGTGIFDPEDTVRYVGLIGSRLNWKMSGIPLGQADKFPEAYDTENRVVSGYNRAKLAWHIIDPVFYPKSSGPSKPPLNYYVELNKPEVRYIYESELFPMPDIPTGMQTLHPTFDLDYYPDEKGPYNFDVEETAYSSGIGQDGSLKSPESRWGAVVRDLETLNFEGVELKYLDIMMMDPYGMRIPPSENNSQAELLIQIGRFSEDINRDGYQFFEYNVEPEFTGKHTCFGIVPFYETAVGEMPPAGDVGLDGLPDELERDYFEDYLNRIKNLYNTTSPAYQKALDDPSTDNYHYFLGPDYDDDPQYGSILKRYKNYNQPEGNSTTNPDVNYSTIYSKLADNEMFGNELPLEFDTTEAYYEYRISLAKDSLNANQKFIKDEFIRGYMSQDNFSETSKWFNFSIPLDEPDRIIGEIQSLADVKQIRLVIRGCNDHFTLRFAWITASRIYDPFPLLSPYDPNPSFLTTEMQIYPNPNNGRCVLNVKYDMATRIEVLDMMGNIVAFKDYGGLKRLAPWEMPSPKYICLPSLEKGVYIVRAFISLDEYTSKKMVVVRE